MGDVSNIAKTGWWASSSTGVKIAVIVVGAALVATTVYYVAFRKPKDVKAEGKKSENAGGGTANSEAKSNNGSSNKTSTSNAATPNTTVSSDRTVDLSSIPNSGGCSSPQLNYDGNYDYVKCDGVWYTQSKPNPKTSGGNIATWKSLKDNTIATEKLDSRYPNG